jgi:two-component system, response regulator
MQPLRSSDQSFEILLVENNLTDATLVMEALKKNNIHNSVLHLSGNDTAVSYINQAGGSVFPFKRVKLIILGIDPPGFMAIEILKMIRQNPLTNTIPVILMSDVAPADLILKSYRLGINSFLVKPAEATMLARDMGRLEVQKIFEPGLN